ncbi:MAG: EAL domain-containing protein [Gammaproteobacteria bacterium]|nr:EAL domain-containing protein [Gammaproteobacteria bacterium]
MRLSSSDSSAGSDQAFYAELLRAYFDSTNDAIFVLCDEMKFVACNRVMQDWLGRKEDELTRHNHRLPITELLPSIDSGGAFRTGFAKARAGETARFAIHIEPERRPTRWVEINMRRVDVEAGELIIAVCRDISDRKAYLDAIEQRATRDPATGLNNRQVFQHHIDSVINKLEPSQSLAITLLDIDRFRDINESLGYPVGDSLLKLVARRFRDFQGSHPGTDIAGLGGDRFGVIFRGHQQYEFALMAQALQAYLSENIDSPAGELILDFTVGMSIFPKHGNGAEELLHKAESALHSAKTHHNRLVIYQPQGITASVDHVKLRVELEKAIRNHQIKPYYQPIIGTRTDTVRLEILARWHTESFGEIEPDEFIPLAEHTGLINDLTFSLARQALTECLPLYDDGTISSLSLNVSPYSLNNTRFPGQLAKLLDEFQLEPEHLILELTEGSILPDSLAATAVLQSLGMLGFRLAVDDFGTGYSSLVRLKLLPIAEIKIDRSFVEKVHENKDDEEIVRAAVLLAHGLGLEVVAEGVERAAAIPLVRDMGCDYLQGYLFSPARSIADIRQTIDRIRGQYLSFDDKAVPEPGEP